MLRFGSRGGGTRVRDPDAVVDAVVDAEADAPTESSEEASSGIYIWKGSHTERRERENETLMKTQEIIH